MAANTLSDLREHLFETLAALRDKKHPMDVARAKAVGDIAQVIINSAKVEVDYLRVTEAGDTSAFLGSPPRTLPAPEGQPGPEQLVRRVHRIR